MRSGRWSAGRAAHLASILLLGAAALALPRPGMCAEPDAPQAARTAYERGTAAFQRGDFAAAAEEFARADELAPNPVALESALEAVLRADDPAFGMVLAERAARAQGGESLAALAAKARERFVGRAGLLTVACPAGWTCQARIDGAAAPVGERRWYAAGSHRLELTANGETERRRIVVVAGASVEVQPLAAAASASHPATPAPAEAAAPPAAAPPPSSASPGSPVQARPAPSDAALPDADADAPRGVSPGWFWLSAGATALAGGLTIVSGVDAMGKHDDFLAHPTEQTEADGRAAETRTNILIGVTGVTAAATLLIGLFAVEWSGPERPGAARVALGVAPSGVHLTTGVRFR